MRKTIIDINRNATLEHVRELRQLLHMGLKACNIQSQTISKIETCFAEAATNCVEHGDSVSCIGLTLYSDNFGWWIEIKDDALEDNLDISTLSKPISIFDLDAESGRGWSLINTLAERIEKISHKDLPTKHESSEPLWNNGLRLAWQHPELDLRPTILVVEDDPALAKLYQTYLNQDFKVILAPDGREALEAIEKQTVQLVISDINMPNMNGIEFRHALNNRLHTELTPFIFLSFTEEVCVIEDAGQMGIDDYLHKPINKQSLLNAAKRVLARFDRVKTKLTDRIDQHITASLVPALPPQLGAWHTVLDSRNTGQGGGDLVLHQSSEKSQLIVVVDVMGHNDAAKFFSHAYAGYIRGLMAAFKQTLAPSKLLEHLSQGIFEDELLSQLTLTCCVVELKENAELTIACAGHPAPLLITEGEAQPLPVKGLLPGLLPQCHYASYTHHLKAGERLAIYTDGLLESAPDNETREQLSNAIVKSLVEMQQETAQMALKETFSVFDRYSQGQPIDDTLLLLIEPL